MWPSLDFADIPQKTFEEFEADLRSCPWGNPKVPEPKTFRSSSRTRLSAYGLELGATKHDDDPRHALSVTRDYEDVRRDRVDFYQVLFQAAGSATFMQNDQVAELAPGDVVLVDLGRPALVANNGGLQFDLVLQRPPLISHLGLQLQGGMRSPRGTGAERALRQLIFDAGDGAEVSDWASGQMQRVIYDLVAVLFEPKFDSPSGSEAMFQRACDIIRDSHVDPDLTSSAVAAEAGMSLRKLQALFTSRGSTCTQHIHSVRLDHALTLLRRRERLMTHELLSQISWACGYRDHNYFARVFRRRFGQSPRAYAKAYDVDRS